MHGITKVKFIETEKVELMLELHKGLPEMFQRFQQDVINAATQYNDGIYRQNCEGVSKDLNGATHDNKYAADQGYGLAQYSSALSYNLATNQAVAETKSRHRITDLLRFETFLDFAAESCCFLASQQTIC
jgi:hypothetical protein